MHKQGVVYPVMYILAANLFTGPLHMQASPLFPPNVSELLNVNRISFGVILSSLPLFPLCSPHLHPMRHPLLIMMC